MSKRFYLYVFLAIFLVSLLSLYFYNYYMIKTASCSIPLNIIKSRNFGITALTASGSLYREREGNETFQFSSRNASIIIGKDGSGNYMVTLKADGIVLIESKASHSKAELMVFNGSNKGEYEPIGDDFLLWLKPCYTTPVMKKLGLTPTPKYLGENIDFSIAHVHRFVQSSVKFYYNGVENYSIIHKQVHVLRDTFEAEGPMLKMTDEHGNYLFDLSYYEGVFLPCGIPVELELIVPAKYVNMSALEHLIGYKPKYGEYINYYALFWDTNWSQIENIKCSKPLFFSDIQVVALSLVVGLIGVLVAWVLKRGR